MQVVDRTGSALGRIGSFGKAPGELSVPLDLLGDSDGRLFLGLGGSSRLEVFGLDTFADPESIAPAVVRIAPNPFDPLNPVENFTAVVEIPGYDLHPIDPASITANGVAALAESMDLGDFDNDGRPDFRIDFPGDALAASFLQSGGARVTLQGLLPEMSFEGWDDVRFVDGDGDGVPDDIDLCLDSLPGQPVNADGCTITQLCPCAGPLGGGAWTNQGAFVACRTLAARDFAAQGLIGRSEINVYVREAAASTCGGEGS